MFQQLNFEENSHDKLTSYSISIFNKNPLFFNEYYYHITNNFFSSNETTINLSQKIECLMDIYNSDKFINIHKVKNNILSSIKEILVKELNPDNIMGLDNFFNNLIFKDLISTFGHNFLLSVFENKFKDIDPSTFANLSPYIKSLIIGAKITSYQYKVKILSTSIFHKKIY